MNIGKGLGELLTGIEPLTSSPPTGGCATPELQKLLIRRNVKKKIVNIGKGLGELLTGIEPLTSSPPTGGCSTPELQKLLIGRNVKKNCEYR